MIASGVLFTYSPVGVATSLRLEIIEKARECIFLASPGVHMDRENYLQQSNNYHLVIIFRLF